MFAEGALFNLMMGANNCDVGISYTAIDDGLFYTLNSGFSAGSCLLTQCLTHALQKECLKKSLSMQEHELNVLDLLILGLQMLLSSSKKSAAEQDKECTNASTDSLVVDNMPSVATNYVDPVAEGAMSFSSQIACKPTVGSDSLVTNRVDNVVLSPVLAVEGTSFRSTESAVLRDKLHLTVLDCQPAELNDQSDAAISCDPIAKGTTSLSAPATTISLTLSSAFVVSERIDQNDISRTLSAFEILSAESTVNEGATKHRQHSLSVSESSPSNVDIPSVPSSSCHPGAADAASPSAPTTSCKLFIGSASGVRELVDEGLVSPTFGACEVSSTPASLNEFAATQKECSGVSEDRSAGVIVPLVASCSPDAGENNMMPSSWPPSACDLNLNSASVVNELAQKGVILPTLDPLEVSGASPVSDETSAIDAVLYLCVTEDPRDDVNEPSDASSSFEAVTKCETSPLPSATTHVFTASSASAVCEHVNRDVRSRTLSTLEISAVSSTLNEGAAGKHVEHSSSVSGHCPANVATQSVPFCSSAPIAADATSPCASTTTFELFIGSASVVREHVDEGLMSPTFGSCEVSSTLTSLNETAATQEKSCGVPEDSPAGDRLPSVASFSPDPGDSKPLSQPPTDWELTASSASVVSKLAEKGVISPSFDALQVLGASPISDETAAKYGEQYLCATEDSRVEVIVTSDVASSCEAVTKCMTSLIPSATTHVFTASSASVVRERVDHDVVSRTFSTLEISATTSDIKEDAAKHVQHSSGVSENSLTKVDIPSVQFGSCDSVAADETSPSLPTTCGQLVISEVSGFREQVDEGLVSPAFDTFEFLSTPGMLHECASTQEECSGIAETQPADEIVPLIASCSPVPVAGGTTPSSPPPTACEFTMNAASVVSVLVEKVVISPTIAASEVSGSSPMSSETSARHKEDPPDYAHVPSNGASCCDPVTMVTTSPFPSSTTCMLTVSSACAVSELVDHCVISRTLSSFEISATTSALNEGSAKHGEQSSSVSVNCPAKVDIPLVLFNSSDPVAADSSSSSVSTTTNELFIGSASGVREQVDKVLVSPTSGMCEFSSTPAMLNECAATQEELSGIAEVPPADHIVPSLASWSPDPIAGDTTPSSPPPTACELTVNSASVVCALVEKGVISPLFATLDVSGGAISPTFDTSELSGASPISNETSLKHEAQQLCVSENPRDYANGPLDASSSCDSVKVATTSSFVSSTMCTLTVSSASAVSKHVDHDVMSQTVRSFEILVRTSALNECAAKRVEHRSSVWENYPAIVDIHSLPFSLSDQVAADATSPFAPMTTCVLFMGSVLGVREHVDVGLVSPTFGACKVSCTPTSPNECTATQEECSGVAEVLLADDIVPSVPSCARDPVVGDTVLSSPPLTAFESTVNSASVVSVLVEKGVISRKFGTLEASGVSPVFNEASANHNEQCSIFYEEAAALFSVPLDATVFYGAPSNEVTVPFGSPTVCEFTVCSASVVIDHVAKGVTSITLCPCEVSVSPGNLKESAAKHEQQCSSVSNGWQAVIASKDAASSVDYFAQDTVLSFAICNARKLTKGSTSVVNYFFDSDLGAVTFEHRSIRKKVVCQPLGRGCSAVIKMKRSTRSHSCRDPLSMKVQWERTRSRRRKPPSRWRFDKMRSLCVLSHIQSSVLRPEEHRSIRKKFLYQPLRRGCSAVNKLERSVRSDLCRDQLSMKVLWERARSRNRKQPSRWRVHKMRSICVRNNIETSVMHPEGTTLVQCDDNWEPPADCEPTLENDAEQEVQPHFKWRVSYIIEPNLTEIASSADCSFNNSSQPKDALDPPCFSGGILDSSSSIEQASYDDNAGYFLKDTVKDTVNSSDIKTAMKRCLSLHEFHDFWVVPTPVLIYTLHSSDSVSEQDYVRNLMALPPEEREALMKSEAERLRTYGSRFWPIRDVMPPEELAAAGFYYTGVHDRVQCAFCRGVLRNWERGDSAMNEHRVHFSYCRLVMGLDCGNVPIASARLNGENTSAVPTRGGQANLFASRDGPLNDVPDNTSFAHLLAHGNDYLATMGSGEPLPGVSTAKPKHPEHAVEARRLQSFSTWPLWALQSPENLTKAGFYYAGFGDNVKCFYCDGGLRNWEIMDNPWEEHARWFKECKYLLDVKGQAYVDEIQKKYAVGNEAARLEVTSAAAASTTSPGSSLEHPSVQLVKSLGYSESQILAALDRYFPQRQTGVMPKGAELLDAVLQMEDEASGASPALSTTGRSLPTGGRVLASEAATFPFAVAASRPSETASMPPRVDRQRPESDGISGPNVPVHSSRAAPDVKRQQEPSPSERPLASLHDIIFTGLLDLPDGETRFVEENRQMHKHLECKGCRQRPAEVVLLPCGHFSSCLECVPSLRNCPVCATVVRGTIRTYLC